MALSANRRGHHFCVEQSGGTLKIFGKKSSILGSERKLKDTSQKGKLMGGHHKADEGGPAVGKGAKEWRTFYRTLTRKRLGLVSYNKKQKKGK